MDVADPGPLCDPADDAVNGASFERSAMIGDEPALGPYVIGVDGGPVGELDDEVGVQRDVAVVAQLADGDPEPVVVADLGDGVGGEIAQLTGA